MKKVFVTLTLAMAFPAGSVYAQIQVQPSPAAEMLDELAYAKSRIIPRLVEQRRKLETRLRESDRQELDLLRRRFVQIAGKVLETPQCMPTNCLEMRTEAINLLYDVQKIRNAYQEPIRELLSEIQSDRARWMDDLGILEVEHDSEDPDPTPADEILPAFFLILPANPNIGALPEARTPLLTQPVPTLEAFFNLNTPFITNTISSVEIFPVPALAQTGNQITFSVARTTPLTIELRAADGRVVRTLFTGTPEAGTTQTIKTDLQGLPSGVYSCEFKANHGNIYSKRIIIGR